MNKRKREEEVYETESSSSDEELSEGEDESNIEVDEMEEPSTDEEEFSDESSDDNEDLDCIAVEILFENTRKSYLKAQKESARNNFKRNKYYSNTLNKLIRPIIKERNQFIATRFISELKEYIISEIKYNSKKQEIKRLKTL